MCGAIQRHKGPMSCECKLIMKLMGFHKTYTVLCGTREPEEDFVLVRFTKFPNSSFSQSG